jgi:co-chaperonin GroES (HSP10)
MRVNDIKRVKPAKENIVVKTIELDKDNKLFFAKSKKQDPRNTELSYGEVIAVGPNAGDPGQCPEITIGDKIVVNRYAGSHIATNELSEIYKVMVGYNVMAKLDDINNIDVDTTSPSSNRVLIAVKLVDATDGELYIPAEEASNPQLEDLDYGVIVKIGPSCKLGYKVGDIVAYNPYSGENVRAAESIDKPALRVLIEEDVLLTI